MNKYLSGVLATFAAATVVTEAEAQNFGAKKTAVCENGVHTITMDSRKENKSGILLSTGSSFRYLGENHRDISFGDNVGVIDPMIGMTGMFSSFLSKHNIYHEGRHGQTFIELRDENGKVTDHAALFDISNGEWQPITGKGGEFWSQSNDDDKGNNRGIQTFQIEVKGCPTGPAKLGPK